MKETSTGFLNTHKDLRLSLPEVKFALFTDVFNFFKLQLVGRQILAKRGPDSRFAVKANTKSR